jgi:protocatechuate 3,4-dioxygenase alpha subunit
MARAKKPLPESPSQTAGPYVHIGCMPNYSGIEGVYAADPGRQLLDVHTSGTRISICGHIYDGDGAPLTDAVVETWQADASGLYPSPQDTRGAAEANFSGWGREPCDAQTGEFRFATIKPGRVPYPDGRLQAPHITLWIVARGINVGLHTRLYFDDEATANAEDPLLAQVDPQDRVATLIAHSTGDGAFRFDIHLQGADETVFLDM